RPPRPILVVTMAGPLAHDHVGSREDPVELGEVMGDALQRRADLGDPPPDLVLAVGQPPLGEADLGVVGEQVEDAPAGRRDPAVVEGLQVLDGHGLALLVGHGLGGDRHVSFPFRHQEVAALPDRLYQGGMSASTLTQMDLASVYSCMASNPISRPYPDWPTPPNGEPGF